MADQGGTGEWCTIESDPGVFTSLLEEIGCKGVELEELWSLDDESLERLQEAGRKVYGFIFLFQWKGEQQQQHAAAKEPLAEDAIPEDLFFAHQVTTNACATQAMLSVVLNAGLEQEQLGSTLSEFQSFTGTFPPQLKGVSISSSEEIRKAHNSFARQDAFLNDEKIHIPTDDDEAFHFVAYVSVNDTVYELDGLQKGPIVVSSSNAMTDADSDDKRNWLGIARQAIQERMSQNDHVKFNLMAVVQDKREPLQTKLASLKEEDAEYSEVMAQLTQEESKREQWKIENQRRRHNYVPLCMQLLRELAMAGNLRELISAAKERGKERAAAKRAAK